jgi:adenosylcobyric acid synthase
MPAKTLMIQGTASSAGKSILVTALCRIFKQDGYSVAPFKSQNMALNSFVTEEGGEIGRAQAVQAEAARVTPSVYMNPILLKSEADHKSQVIVMGKVFQTVDAKNYYDYTPELVHTVENALNKLRSEYDIVVIEGAGSPAEINFREREIVNMRVARMSNSPVLLVGDIDRGGVFASIVGTLALLTREERSLIKGSIINKFRGDVELLKPGIRLLEKYSHRPVLGIIPYFHDIQIAQEDSVYLDERPDSRNDSGIYVAIIRLPYISNYDDFDPLEVMGCSVTYATDPSQLNKADLIIIPGTKTTIADLIYIKQKGFADKIIEKAKKGTAVIGICGGYQMLGKTISDPDHIESKETGTSGLGLLNNETVFIPEKATTQIKARITADKGLFSDMNDITITGYEIHMGRDSIQNDQPVFKVIETPDGSAAYPDGTINQAGNVFGTYIHGLFHNIEFTRKLIQRLRLDKNLPDTETPLLNKQKQYDELADIVRQNVDLDQIYKITLGRNYRGKE